jgi:hypothetical protein
MVMIRFSLGCRIGQVRGALVSGGGTGWPTEVDGDVEIDCPGIERGTLGLAQAFWGLAWTARDPS